MRLAARTIKLAGSAPWAVATYGDGNQYPLTYDDVSRDTVAAKRALASVELPPHGAVLITSKLEELGHFWPFTAAAAELGHLVLSADSTFFDAVRSEMLLRRFPVALALGINQPVLDGLAAAGYDPAAVLRRAAAVICRADALEAVRSMGVSARCWLALGPTYALECRYGNLHVDGDEWELRDGDQGLVVRAKRGRGIGSADVPTGVAARVGTARCSCGRSDDPLVSLT